MTKLLPGIRVDDNFQQQTNDMNGTQTIQDNLSGNLMVCLQGKWMDQKLLTLHEKS